MWAAIAFLVGFAVLLLVLSHYFLLPAFDALKKATPADKAKLRAWSALLLAIMLVILISGLILTFRVGRFFFPRDTGPRVRTKHVDVWAEAGKRMKVTDLPPDSDE
jgi:hypothetical protein